ncbi:MAG TPA: 5-(carboxyamino)imidazole ribonucleotide synthase [Steroidobacteraceae bacterium]|nr:5-(carboxyamino)imidazole ribonucleotide synthase [Steroidobacteraceae bacterium]
MKVAIIGAGQLGRMLALAGYPLGIDAEFYDRTTDAPGGQVGPIVTGEFDDQARLATLARRVAVVTFDWENVPVASLRACARYAPVYPQPDVLAVAQDRLLEKTLFRDLGIPTPPFAPVDIRSDLEAAVRRIGLPGVLKTRRFGYDGKGQARLRRSADIEPAWRMLGGQPLIYEGFVEFTREVSLLAARSTRGEVVCYPLTENVHEHGILASSRAPYRAVRLQRTAERYVRAILRRYRYAGVLAVEFFVAGGALIANEMAPRVHNSGHWTIEGACTSQFENHLRAICGLPLGSPSARGYSAMVNFVGRLPSIGRALRERGLHLHVYGKREARPGRKLGHATVVTDSAAARDRALRRVLRLR